MYPIFQSHPGSFALRQEIPKQPLEELVMAMELGDQWDDAKLISAVKYLAKSSKVVVPPQFQQVMNKVLADL